jgi:hypothetical protein
VALPIDFDLAIDFTLTLTILPIIGSPFHDRQLPSSPTALQNWHDRD